MVSDMAGEKKISKKLSDNFTIITAKRSMNMSKTYLLIAFVIAALALTVWSPVTLTPLNSITSTNTTTNSISANTIINTTAKSASSTKAYGLIAVPLGILPTIMLTTPVILLFVYDKNNGLLEYFLSLGMTQKDIYMQYLKAALLMVAIFLIVFVSINLAIGLLAKDVTLTAESSALTVALAIPAVSFMMVSMMAFSSLQKTRAGGNQPIGIFLGTVVIIPDYIFPFVFSLKNTILIEAAQAVIIGIVAVIFLLLSSKLVRRENLLP
jgi:hypothetical protein